MCLELINSKLINEMIVINRFVFLIYLLNAHIANKTAIIKTETYSFRSSTVLKENHTNYDYVNQVLMRVLRVP